MAESESKFTANAANALDAQVRETGIAKDVSGVLNHEFFFRFHINREFTLLRGTMGAVAVSNDLALQLFPRSPIVFRGQPLLYFTWSGTSWGAVVEGRSLFTYFGTLVIYR